MFNTLRAKITVITVTMLITMSFVMACFTFFFMRAAKESILISHSLQLDNFAQGINKEIMKLENNAKNLALLGEFYYRKEMDKTAVEQAIIGIFKIYKNSLGGGIWYEPYKFNKNEKRNCIYAYKNKQNNIVLDARFNGEEYDYPTQKWYKEISSQVKKEHDTDWSSPYYENIGSEALMITAGTGMFDKNGKFIGMSTVDWDMGSILENISKIKPTQNSFALFADKDSDYILISTDPNLDNKNLVGKSLKNIPWYNNNLKKVTYFTYQNKKYIPYVKTLDNNMILIVCIPKTEMFAKAVAHVVILIIVVLFLSCIISQILYLLLKNSVMKPIGKLTFMANKISKGEDVQIKIENPTDFAHLAETFDKMTRNIKTITKEQERINSELNIAKEIQASSLPSKFPAFPNQNAFDVYASMTPAKEVGGDFYDFYFIDDKNFMFLIADVSGKGVPAALFMMTTKTLIQNLSRVGYPPKELIKMINKEICSNNQQGFFITMFSGIVNIETGNIVYVNCGHNPPLIKTKDEEYKYLDLPSNIVLGAFDGAEFEIKEAQLKKDDTLFLYTDGLTEALNKDGEMFGEGRLEDCVNRFDNDDLKQMSVDVKKEIMAFTDGEPQSDDLTMLIFKYKESMNPKKYKDKAIQENYKNFCSWIEDTAKEWTLSDALTNKLLMCAEEIFANITFYSYPDKVGEVETTITKDDKKITFKFEDWGIRYNPLEKPDPDITLPPEERPLGGLGIFMVKQMSDEISYEYSDNKNILTITFLNA